MMEAYPKGHTRVSSLKGPPLAKSATFLRAHERRMRYKQVSCKRRGAGDDTVAPKSPEEPRTTPQSQIY